MLSQDLLWRLFATTGTVDFYLAYRELAAENGEEEGQGEDPGDPTGRGAGAGGEESLN